MSRAGKAVRDLHREVHEAVFGKCFGYSLTLSHRLTPQVEKDLDRLWPTFDRATKGWINRNVRRAATARARKGRTS